MKYLEKVNCPADLKGLKFGQMNALAAEMRDFLVQSVARTGGHLASNLGVVELSIALHYCLNSPVDKLIWDVGHQCYPHKILTGRREQFDTLRQFGGMSGFIKSAESPHDTFDVGHSSTSLSVAHGMAVSRDLLGQSHKVAAVIGDGAMGSGLALEALNNIGRSSSDILVVLNDNQMSISENVGALAGYLNEMRTKPAYISVKRDVKNILKNIPIVGKYTESFLNQAKTKLKYLLLPGVWFEELGFRYYGPVDGHNLRHLVEILTSLQRVRGPVFLHVLTQKGKGYAPAERESLKFHGISPFCAKTGEVAEAPESTSYTDIFAEKIVEIGRKNGKVAAITAAMPTGTGLANFKAHFPRRFFDVGIAESHAVTFAAGMAKSGLRPVVAIYSTFLQRAYDQIIHDVCIQSLPVVFILDRAGLVAADGETHQGVFDLSYLLHMPNMTVMSPRSGAELAQMLDFALELGTPVAIRYAKEEISKIYLDAHKPLELGKWEILEQGQKIAILALGSMVDKAANVYKKLRYFGHDPTLINARFAKPLNPEITADLADYEYIFTMEENVLAGGFGQAVAAALSQSPKIHHFALPDEFLPQGTRAEIFAHLGLDADGMTEKILEILAHG
ncbi:MAG: 1-deoxy-D-xylulose-5-phosphate synthase [Clostridiales bacterium]|jgi:1-deoxy-D-xylulose-5-phosphate synthase|nr:1-deoxy-D-xylulose-5-phosphate synthase [Clostridiales bacterium]